MKCVLCGKEVEERKPCPYNRTSNGPTCDDCCEVCYRSEPFPCKAYEQRKIIKKGR